MTVRQRQKLTYLEDYSGEKELDDKGRKASDIVPFFDLKSISAATHNFSIDNKLGEGGFGSVYKVFFLAKISQVV